LFRELHKRPEILILPNPWDAGTAKLLASLGFEALATTSLGMSNALGRIDGEGSVSRAELLENCRVIAQATELPVNADLENGYADDPREAASILRDAAEVGIVGGSIEDWSGERIYEFNHAVERVAAGAEMARSLPVPFTFVARAENLIRGRLDLDDTIKRLQAFEKAGADVLYAPGLRDLATMRTGAGRRQAFERGDERRRSLSHRRRDGSGRRQAAERRRSAIAAGARRLHERRP
jgi:2-methylisocitrate lyase-like PEP mutase family enzyme